MAQKSAKKTLWGFTTASLLGQHLQATAVAGKKTVQVFVHLNKKARLTTDKDQIHLYPLSSPESETETLLRSTPATRVRDAVGGCLTTLEKMDVGRVEFNFNLDPLTLEGALLGLELGLYRYKRVFGGELPSYSLGLKNKNKVIPAKILTTATQLGVAVNLARHFTNLPPNLLNPVTYAEAVKAVMGGLKNVSVEVWDEKRLAKENMNLLLAVGAGSSTPARLVHIRYRPTGAKKAPVALVGKGITFDSGGLDIKPAAGMRLMKKDMGGSAAVLALAHWAASSGLKCALDVYMPMAENSVSSRAYRPSDVLISRAGLSVEIHNTDAEGRLVVADAMDVAATQTEKPQILIDVATLTGAIKVALGSGVAGLFSNTPALAQAIAKAGQQSGDWAWVMPLYQRYRSQLSSSFADMINSPDGFGGAVTAALFLEKFTRGIAWAHLDIYAWKDSSEGAWLESGGNGQSVLGLARYLTSL